MVSFLEFYQHGGVAMHAISVLGIAATVMLVKRYGAMKRGAPRPGGDPLGLAFILAALGFGVLGVALGWIELNAALRTVPTDSWPAALNRGGQIVAYPLAWALLVAIPLTLVRGVVGHIEQRVRSARAPA